MTAAMEKVSPPPPVSYYHFLAGWTRSLGLRQILEIGTHRGGSATAMRKGLADESVSESKLVTVDLFPKKSRLLEAHPEIIRITGNCLNPRIIQSVASHFRAPIDMIFIDAVHRGWFVGAAMEYYARLLNPKYIILDDIRRNSSMADFWKKAETILGEHSFDATEISMRHGFGFGIICWDPNLPTIFKGGCFIRILQKTASLI